MLYPSFKLSNVFKTVIFVFLLSFLILPVKPADAALTADWGDLVEVYYIHWPNLDHSGSPDETNTRDNVYLSTGSTIPPEVLAVDPQASTSWYPQFKSGIVGITVGGTKRFTAPSSGEHSFEVTLIEIRYDAVVDNPAT